MDTTAEDITYTKSFQATPDLNGKDLKCIAKFNYSGPGQEQNSPDDIQLWTSESLQVHCKHICY